MRRHFVKIAMGVFVTLALGLTGCGGGGDGGTTPTNTNATTTGGTFGTGNFIVTVADKSIPPDANASPVATAESAIPADVIVKSYETNVTAGAKAYTLKIGSTGFQTSIVGSTRLEVPFDRNVVPDKTKIDSLHLLLRIFNADDKSVVDLTGQIIGDKIVVDLTGFPASATVTVLFNPNMAAVTSDSVAAKSSAKTAALTSTTWASRRWAVVYDKVKVAPEVQKFLGLSLAPTDAQIKLAVKQQVANYAADAAAIYQGEGFRSPTLYIAKTAAEPGGEDYGVTPRYLLHFQDLESNSFASEAYQQQEQIVESNGNYYGRIYIKDTTINRKFQITGGTIYMTIAHELFHAVQAGYDLIGKPQLTGVIEGTATAYGVLLGLRHDGDSAAVPQVRQWLNDPNLIKSETYKLENYLFNINGSDAYANQDFFVYLARTLGNNNYEYLTTLFEQLRLDLEDEALQQTNPVGQANFLANPPLATVYKAFDSLLAGTYGTTFVQVYGDFVKQRAIEHNGASQFGRPGEITNGLAANLFNNFIESTLKDVQIDPTLAATTLMNDWPPLSVFSSRVLRIKPVAGKAGGDLTISITPSKGTFGTTVSGWIYRKQSTASVPLLAVNSITDFGADSNDEVIIIMINPSFVTSDVSINCAIETKATGRSRTLTIDILPRSSDADPVILGGTYLLPLTISATGQISYDYTHNSNLSNEETRVTHIWGTGSYNGKLLTLTGSWTEVATGGSHSGYLRQNDSGTFNLQTRGYYDDPPAQTHATTVRVTEYGTRENINQTPNFSIWDLSQLD